MLQDLYSFLILKVALRYQPLYIYIYISIFILKIEVPKQYLYFGTSNLVEISLLAGFKFLIKENHGKVKNFEIFI